MILLLPLLLITACSFQAAPTSLTTTATITPLAFSTATLVSTFTPRPSATIVTPTITPTLKPMLATLSTQVNVRVGPDKKLTSLGQLEFGAQVRVIGRDSGSAWLEIVYPENSSSTGWITVEFVKVDGEISAIPVVEYIPAAQAASAQSPTPAGPVPTPTPAPHTASLSAQIYVRKGPAQTFESLGMINAGTLVTLTGRSQNNVWVQILYEGGVDGKGWVAASYLLNSDLNGLPFFDNQGNFLAAGTPPPAPGKVTLTPTAFSPAAADSDSEKAPGAKIKFARDAAGEIAYSSELSSPSGDASDWVSFIPYEPNNQATYLYLKLECSGNGGITAILEKNSLPVPDTRPLLCGNYDFAIKVLGGQEYILVLSADGSASALRYTKYILTIRSER